MSDAYVVKISKGDVTVEVSAPDSSWVESKIDGLMSLVNSAQIPANSGTSRRRSPRRTPASPETGPAASAEGTSRPRRTRTARPQRNVDLETRLNREAQIQLQEYIDARRQAWDAKQTHQAVIIATFLHDELSWPGVDEDDMYTVYRLLSLDAPSNFRSQLQNATNRDRFFMGSTDGKYTLSLAGENFARRAAETA
jgi:hypothetical protein